MANARAALWALHVGGVLLTISGVLVAAVFGTLRYVGPLYVILGLVLVALGLAWIYKVRRAELKYTHRPGRGRTVRAVAAALLALALLPAEITGLGGVMVARAQTTTPGSSYCYTAYLYTTYMQYVVLGFLAVMVILAFIPVILGRTPLGPVFSELMGFSGVTIVLLIFVLLFIFPLNVMFTQAGSTSPPTPYSCTVNLQNLENNGPPLLKALLSIITGLVPQTP